MEPSGSKAKKGQAQHFIFYYRTLEQPNLNYINELAGNDVSFRNKLIQTIKRELPEEVATYNACLQDGNFRATAAAVHKLKHKISVMGLERSYTFAETFEAELLVENTQGADAFEKILKCMLDFVDSL